MACALLELSSSRCFPRNGKVPKGRFRQQITDISDVLLKTESYAHSFGQRGSSHFYVHCTSVMVTEHIGGDFHPSSLIQGEKEKAFISKYYTTFYLLGQSRYYCQRELMSSEFWSNPNLTPPYWGSHAKKGVEQEALEGKGDVNSLFPL